jgi:hypothetical protein
MRFAPSERQIYWAAIAALIALLLATFWSVSVLPCQDLPQHLAYARIFIDYPRPDLRFSELYQLPKHFEPYFTIYFVLARLGSWMTLDVALRLVMSFFVVAVFLSSHHLVSACQRDGKRGWSAPAWPALLSCLLVFGPTTTLGFLSFALCIPVFLVASGAVVGWMGPHPHRSDPLVAVGACVLMPSMHVVAAGMFVGVVALHVLLNRKWRHARKGVALVLLTASVAAAWNRFGNLGVGRPPTFDFEDASSRALGLELVSSLLRLSWSDPPMVLSQVLWTVFGPYRWFPMFLVATSMGLTIAIVRSQPRGKEPWNNPLRRTAVGFGLCSLVVPWGMYVPSEVTFINLRMMGLALGLCIALVDPAWFAARRAQLALVVLCIFCVCNYGVRAVRFDREAGTALRLVKVVPDNAILMSLTFHNRSDYFAKQFRLSHFLPMYYAVKQGGINTQFWAKYTDHLPIDYRPGKRPKHTPDWRPETVERSHLVESDYLLMQTATRDDPRDVRAASERAVRLVRDHGVEVACDGLWCLYRLEQPSP